MTPPGARPDSGRSAVPQADARRDGPRATKPPPYGRRKDTAPTAWQDVTIVAHYDLTVDALKRLVGFSDRLQAPFVGAL
jgi:hypothetical protein